MQKYSLHLVVIIVWIAVFFVDSDTPVNSPVEEPIVQIEPPLRLVFSGDVMQHMPQVTAARRGESFDYEPSFRYVAPLWRGADFAIVNFETTVSANGRYSGYPTFASPVELIGYLKKAGVDVLALANNHICDKGATGVRTTTAAIDSAQLIRTGAYADTATSKIVTLLTKGSYRVALLNYTYGTNGIPVPRGMVVNLIDTTLIARHIDQARDSMATHIITFFHWGNEYERRANKHQRELAAWCRKAGADVVVGSHPHVVQQIDTALCVVYSLGNFVSNQRERYTDAGITVAITLSHDTKPQIEFTPHWVELYGEKERYRVLLPSDSMATKQKSAMMRSISDNIKIVGPCNVIK